MILTTKQQAHIARIFDIVSQITGATRAEMVSRNRQQGIVDARWIAIYCVYVTMNLSLQRIGNIFGGRDHTSILSALKKVKTRKAYDGILSDKIDDVMQQLGNALPIPDCNTTESDILRLILDAQTLINKAAAIMAASVNK